MHGRATFDDGLTPELNGRSGNGVTNFINADIDDDGRVDAVVVLY